MVSKYRWCEVIIITVSVRTPYLLIWHPKIWTITKTCLYNFYSLKTQFYIVKLGFTGVYIIFLISPKNRDCWYSLEPPQRGGSNEYPQSMFWAEIWKISKNFIWKFSFFVVQFSVYLNRRVFVMQPNFTSYWCFWVAGWGAYNVTLNRRRFF